MDNLFEQMANISKAHAYDIVSKQRDELLEENKRLSASNKELMGALKWIEMKSWQKDEWRDMKDINDKAKATIQNNTIKP